MPPTALTTANVPHQATALPFAASFTFLADDTDAHDYSLTSWDRPGLAISVDNPSDKVLTVTVYSSPSLTADVGESGVVQVRTFTVAAGAEKRRVILAAAPFYLVRCKFGATPDGSTVTVRMAGVTATNARDDQDPADGFVVTIDAVQLDDAPTTTSGAAVFLGSKKDGPETLAVRVQATKTGAPTNIQFFLEFSDDEAFTNAWIYDEDGWAARVVGAGSVSGTYRRVWKAPNLGLWGRIRAVATGTDGAKYFTVSAWIGREW